jgi:hypothetical protein
MTDEQVFRKNQKVYIVNGATNWLEKYLEKDRELVNIDNSEATIIEPIGENEYKIQSDINNYITIIPIEFIQKIKRKINWWLEDTEFISKSDFHDLYYMETLCKYISNMVKNIPIPVLVSYDKKNKAIYFSIGKIKKGFDININVSYYDFITIVKRWLKQFFPSYEVEKEIELTEDEIAILIKRRKEKGEKVDYNEILLQRKKVKEKGIIEKIIMIEDTFTLYKDNGERELRMSGSIEFPMSLSTFLDKLKKISNQRKRYNFIVENSNVLKTLHKSKQEISINYQGEQLFNFFEINFEDLKEYELQKIDDFHYKWGNFRIKFESISLRNDCLNFYNKEKEKVNG